MVDNIKLLIDGDLISYEAASAADMVDEGMERRGWDWTAEHLDKTIINICEACGVQSPAYIFLTGTGNFRFDIATVKPYKGNRKGEKPFYLPNVRMYLQAQYGAVVVNGMEADDALTITAGRYKPDEVIIASRDKDLRQFPCLQYSWEVGNQPEWGVEMVDEIGDIHVRRSTKTLKNGEPSKAIDKIWGTGLMWFYTQCITGDTTDNIAGLEGKGAALAYEILHGLKTEKEMFLAVLLAYKGKYGELAEERLLEQGRLLYMCREMKDGKAVMWEFPEEQGE